MDIAEALGLAGLELYVKDESASPFGTHKDRKSRFVVERAVRLDNQSALCIITSGNAGRALAHYAAPHGIPVVAIVGRSLAPSLREALEGTGALVAEADLRSKRWRRRDLEDLAAGVAQQQCFDVSNVPHPYADVANELFQNIRSFPTGRPHVCVLPVGGAELFVGFTKWLLTRADLTQDVDIRVVGVRTHDPASLADKLYCSWSPCWGPARLLTEERPYITLRTVDESGLGSTTDRLARLLHVEPSSALAFHALPQIDLPPDAVVHVVNTGAFRWGPDALSA